MIQAHTIYILEMKEVLQVPLLRFSLARCKKGQIGAGQVGVTTYVVPTGAFSFGRNALSSLTFLMK